MPLPTPTQGETEREFISRCVPVAEEESSNTEQAVAICASLFDTRDDAETFKPPKGAAENAQRVLDWREEHGDEVKGMTRTGWTRANQIASRENLSRDTVGRIAAFERHRKNAEIAEEHKGEPWKDAGYVAWLGWGGDEGVRWAQGIVDRTDAIRADFSEIKGRMEETEEGYLRGNAIVTRTGVFEYLQPDGTVRRELRHPDDVFAAESISTLKMIPVTDDHPSELVTADTAESLSVGQTGENAHPDGKYLLVPFTVTHKRGIEAVRNGKRELSLGYRCELVQEPGEYNGQPYDVRQTNIRYNHLAIVSRARAGGAARINMDGAAVQSTTNRTDQEATMPNVQVNLDGITYDAAPEVAKALEKAQSELADVRADADMTKKDMQSKIDEYQAKIDAMKEEMDKMKSDASDEKIRERVDARLDLERGAAKLVSDDKFDGMSDREVMVKAVTEARPTFDATDKSDDYVKAAFDMAIESAGDDKAIEKQRADTAEPVEGNAPKQSIRGDQSRLDALINKSRGGE